MKILMTLMGLEIGGAETHVTELVRELHRRGHTVIVASNGGVYESALSDAGIRHVQIPMHRRSPGDMLRSLVMLRRLIQQEQPDLVHAHARIPAFLCGILHRQMGFPFITSAHGVFAVTPLLCTFTDWGQRTVAVSEDIRTYLMESYGVPPDQIHLTINAVDTRNFCAGPRDEELARELNLGTGPVIGHISRLDQATVKAARELIALMPRVLEAHPNAQLLIVGGGNQEPSLRCEADQINARAGRKAIVMTGSRTDIARLIRQCDVFVGVSRAALEAVSCGKPAILAGNEGYIGTLTPDVLSQAQQSNFCCRGFEPICGDRLLGDLLHLLSLDAAEREALVRFGRELIETDYSVSKMTQDYLDAYEALLNPKRVIKAAVSGYYGFGNLGDDAILHAISDMFRQFPVPVRLTVLSNSPPDTIRQYRLNAVPRFSPLGLWRTLKESDLLISGGGSLLQNKTSTRSLIYYLAVIRLAQLLHKPVVVYANGIGPLLGSSNRRLVRRAIEKCALVTLRDQQSLEELRSVGVLRRDLHVTGDPAFTLKPTHAPRELLRELGIEDDRQVVGISVRELRDNNHFPEQFARLCDRLSLELGKTIVFLVMQESRDEALSRRIMEQMTAPAYLAKTPGDPGAMLSLIRDMDAVVSMRLHTIIFAAQMQVPVAGCIYDPKVAAFLDLLELPSCGTPRDMDADHAFEVTAGLLRDRTAVCARLGGIIAEQTRQAETTTALFAAMLREQGLM